MNNNEVVVCVASTNKLQTPSVHQKTKPSEWVKPPELKAISKAHQHLKGKHTKRKDGNERVVGDQESVMSSKSRDKITSVREEWLLEVNAAKKPQEPRFHLVEE